MKSTTTTSTRAALLAAAALTAGAAVAHADMADMKFTGTGAGSNVRLTLDGANMNVFAGQLKHTIQNITGPAALAGEKLTFCSDILQHVTSSFAAYDIYALPTVPPLFPSATDKVNALNGLFQNFGASALAVNANNDLAAAFQVAVWEIVSDYDGTAASLSLTGGHLLTAKTDGSPLGGAILTNLNSMFAAASASSSASGAISVYAFVNGTAQDQLVAIVPAPGTAALAGLGLLCMGRRRRVK
ncbi:hypothetical protein BH11PLA1_BH11PLA1_21450 [soil metagenome]